MAPSTASACPVTEDAASEHSQTTAAAISSGFPQPKTRFTLVVTLLLVYALLTLAPLVLLPHPLSAL